MASKNFDDDGEFSWDSSVYALLETQECLEKNPNLVEFDEDQLIDSYERQKALFVCKVCQCTYKRIGGLEFFNSYLSLRRTKNPVVGRRRNEVKSDKINLLGQNIITDKYYENLDREIAHTFLKKRRIYPWVRPWG